MHDLTELITLSNNSTSLNTTNTRPCTYGWKEGREKGRKAGRQVGRLQSSLSVSRSPSCIPKVQDKSMLDVIQREQSTLPAAARRWLFSCVASSFRFLAPRQPHRHVMGDYSQGHTRIAMVRVRGVSMLLLKPSCFAARGARKYR